MTMKQMASMDNIIFVAITNGDVKMYVYIIIVTFISALIAGCFALFSILILVLRNKLERKIAVEECVCVKENRKEVKRGFYVAKLISEEAQ